MLNEGMRGTNRVEQVWSEYGVIGELKSFPRDESSFCKACRETAAVELFSAEDGMSEKQLRPTWMLSLGLES